MAYRLLSSVSWSVYSASYGGISLHVGSQDPSPIDIAFKGDGTKMYIIGITSNSIYEYSVNSPWNIGTASYSGVSFYVGAQDSVPYAISFKNDGTKAYVLGSANDFVYEYSINSPWNIDTASYSGVSFNVRSQDNGARDIAFKDDGTKMYMVGATSDSIYEYSINSPWNIGTASYSGVSFYVGSQSSSAYGIAFKNDGTKLHVVDITNRLVLEYYLDSPWSIAIASYSNISFDVGNQDTSPTGIFFKDDDYKMYVLGVASDSVHEYSIVTGYIDVQPEYDFQDDSIKIEDRHKTRGAKEYIYKWADNKKVSFSLSYINSSDRHLINDAWRNNADLTFQDLNNSSDVFSCHIINASLPIGQFVKPYTNLFKGKIELGSY